MKTLGEAQLPVLKTSSIEKCFNAINEVDTWRTECGLIFRDSIKLLSASLWANRTACLM